MERIHRPVRAVVVGLGLVLPLTVACGTADRPDAVPAVTTSPATPAATAPERCVDAEEATRPDLDGEAVWVRFCPGREGLTVPAEVPSDALTTHLDAVEDLRVVEPPAARPDPWCRAFSSRTYRLQVGYADGRVAQVVGPTGPDCPGRLGGPGESGTTVRGPDGLGVFGVAMAAFGRQYADGFSETAGDIPLECPRGARDPDSVDVDGPSADLRTGYFLGRPEPMLMPVTAVRGILCTWRAGLPEPTDVRALSGEEAERVRIGMHAILQAMADCEPRPGRPTYVAVVEDATGTRRAVTVIESECSTVIRSDDGYGLGFDWLDETAWRP